MRVSVAGSGAWGAVVMLGLAAAGCRSLHVEARALADVNDGQPVALHVHQMAKIPSGLPALGCAELRPTAEPPAWATGRLGPPTVLSVLPDRRTAVTANRAVKARWALVVPEWEDCAGASGWALVPLAPGTRRIRFELSRRELALPWDRAVPSDGGKRWKQRGYVDGQPFHVVARAARATR